MIAPDAVNTSGTEPWNHTCSGEDRVLVVGVYANDGSEGSGVTYNGVPMTFLIAGNNGLNTLSLYYLVAPDTGTHAIDVNIGGVPFVFGYSASYTGVDQDNPINTYNSNSAPNGATYFHNIEPTSSSWLVAAIIAGDNIAAGDDTTDRATNASGHGIYDSNAPATGHLNWTSAGNPYWLSMALALQVKGGGSGFFPLLTRLLNHK